MSNVIKMPEKRAKRLANYCQLDKNKEGLIPDDIYANFKSIFPEWPYSVGDQLIAPQDNRPCPVDKTPCFFGWMSGNGAIIEWNESAGCLTKSEFHALVSQRAKRFIALHTTPHEPALPNTCYLHKDLPEDGYAGALDGLLEYFLLATPADKMLLRAAFLTLFWGGPPGARPAFVIMSEDDDKAGGRGIGKSTVSEIMAAITDGAIDLSFKDDADSAKRRILTAGSQRIVRYDNVKETGALSSADVESLITTRYISGHKLYAGDAARPNVYTYVFTFNDQIFSRDMSQRSVPITLKRPDWDSSWLRRLNSYVDRNKSLIVADAINILKQPCDYDANGYRYSLWASQVLGRCGDKGETDTAIKHIKAKQNELDADQDLSQKIFDIIENSLSEYTVAVGMTGAPKKYSDLDNKPALLIRQSVVYDWVREGLALGRISNIAVSREIQRARVSHIQGRHTKHGLYYYFWYKHGAQFAAPGGGYTDTPREVYVLKDKAIDQMELTLLRK